MSAAPKKRALTEAQTVQFGQLAGKCAELSEIVVSFKGTAVESAVQALVRDMTANARGKKAGTPRQRKGSATKPKAGSGVGKTKPSKEKKTKQQKPKKDKTAAATKPKKAKPAEPTAKRQLVFDDADSMADAVEKTLEAVQPPHM